MRPLKLSRSQTLVTGHIDQLLNHDDTSAHHRQSVIAEISESLENALKYAGIHAVTDEHRRIAERMIKNFTRLGMTAECVIDAAVKSFVEKGGAEAFIQTFEAAKGK